MQVMRECVYMACNNLVTVTLLIHAANQFIDVSATLNIILEVRFSYLTCKRCCVGPDFFFPFYFWRRLTAQ